MTVYAIVPATTAIAGRGAAGEQLTTVRVGALGAVVGAPRRRMAPSRDALLAYDALIRRLAARTSAILPARFGTHVADASEIALILAARQATLRRALTHVRARVQMTLRVPTLDPGSTPGQARVKPGSGTQFLRQRAAAAAAERAVPGFEPVRTATARWVRDERVEKRDRLASVFHLVPAGSVTAYRRAVEKAAAANAIRVTVSGPFPPYAFAAI